MSTTSGRPRYLPKAEQGRRLTILRDLWLEGLPIALIAERIGVAPCTVSQMARAAGLPPRHQQRGRGGAT